jgi:hypothetical protein
MKAGKATTYAKVMPTVRLVHRKYLCRLTTRSAKSLSGISMARERAECEGVEHTVIFDQRRVHRQGYSEQVSSEIINWQGRRDDAH